MSRRATSIPPAIPRAATSPRQLTVPLVDDVMLHHPKTWPADLGLDQARTLLADDHLQALLLVAGRRLLGVVVAEDLPAPPGTADTEQASVLAVSRRAGRTVPAGTPLAVADALLVDSTSRRLAVVDDRGDLLGLLCLKRRRHGYCSDADVAARRAARA